MMERDRYFELSESMKGEIVNVVTRHGDTLTGLWKSNQINDRTGEIRMVIEMEKRDSYINCNQILTIEKS